MGFRLPADSLTPGDTFRLNDQGADLAILAIAPDPDDEDYLIITIDDYPEARTIRLTTDDKVLLPEYNDDGTWEMYNE